MENENLKFINVNSWDIPKPYRDKQVRAILDKLVGMKRGETVRVDVEKRRVRLLQSSVWRQIKRHKMYSTLGVRISVSEGQLYLEKPQE